MTVGTVFLIVAVIVAVRLYAKITSGIVKTGIKVAAVIFVGGMLVKHNDALLNLYVRYTDITYPFIIEKAQSLFDGWEVLLQKLK